MGEMTPRERVRASLSLAEPDRVPLDLGGINTTLMIGTYENLKNHVGFGEIPNRILSKIWQIVEPDERILQRFSIDTRYIFPKGMASESVEQSAAAGGGAETGKSSHGVTPTSTSGVSPGSSSCTTTRS